MVRDLSRRIDSFKLVIRALESKNCRSCDGERMKEVRSSMQDCS